MDTLAEIQERHDAVRDLERKLLDLQQVFHDYNFLFVLYVLNCCFLCPIMCCV